MKKILGTAGLMAAIALVFVLPLAGTLAVAEGGDDEAKALFDKKCAMCHGKDGVAKKMAEGSANLNDPDWQAGTSVEAIAKAIAEGAGKMKGFEGKLTAEQMTAVAEYVLTLE